jgi:hypothetical protein
MMLKVIVYVDVDTTDTDIEDMRDEICSAAQEVLGKYPEQVTIELDE